MYIAIVWPLYLAKVLLSPNTFTLKSKYEYFSPCEIIAVLFGLEVLKILQKKLSGQVQNVGVN